MRLSWHSQAHQGVCQPEGGEIQKIFDKRKKTKKLKYQKTKDRMQKTKNKRQTQRQMQTQRQTQRDSQAHQDICQTKARANTKYI